MAVFAPPRPMAADLASRPAVVPVLPVAHLRHLIGIARALRQERHACLAMDMSAVGAIANLEVTGGSIMVQIELVDVFKINRNAHAKKKTC